MSLDATLRLLAKASGLTAADLAAAIPRAGVSTVKAWLAGDSANTRGSHDASAAHEPGGAGASGAAAAAGPISATRRPGADSASAAARPTAPRPTTATSTRSMQRV